MNLKVGIVGLPNAGKSTLFNALLKKQVADTANYPFTTIEPNVGVVPVPDLRIEKIAKVVGATEGKTPLVVPAVVEFVDIAGLVKGASQGEGLGNKFLSHIREVDLVVHVLRYFDDPSVVHVAGDVDANRDKEIIETELILADLQTLEKQQEPVGFAQGAPRQGKSTKEDFVKWRAICKLKEGLNAGKPARLVLEDPDDRTATQGLHLLSMKPVLYVLNVSESQLGSDVGNLKPSIVISAKTESELAGMSQDEQSAYLKELGLEASGLDRLIAKAYDMLGLVSFLTCGTVEARAWTIVQGTCALQAAGIIHTDFEKKFIKADVVEYDDFMNPGRVASPEPREGGWARSREAGRVRSEGKKYVVQDGDVIEFKFGA